ncbi:hypothetical protein lerEdw1_010555, partial [Lerista edwardsae]
GTWQEPLQEWAVRLLDAKEEHLDMVQGEVSKERAEIFKDSQHNFNGEVTLPGLGIACPTSLLPPEGQDRSEAELTKALGIHVNQVINPRKSGQLLHMVECTSMQSSQQTTFWKVLQEDGQNVDSLVDSDGLPRDPVDRRIEQAVRRAFDAAAGSLRASVAGSMFSRAVFLWIRELLADFDVPAEIGAGLGGKKGRWVKEEGGKEEVVGSLKRGQQNMSNIPLPVSADDGKGNQLEVKNDQLGGNEPVETARGGQGTMQKNMLETAEMKSELCDLNSRQGIEPVTGWKESGELTEGLGAACSNPSPVDAEEGKALFSKYGRRYCPKLDKYHSSRMEVKNYDCLDSEEPLQEWALGLLDAKEERFDTVQGEISKECAEIFKGTQHNFDGEVTLPGLAVARPTSWLPPEGQDRSEAEPPEALGIHVNQVMNPRKTGQLLHMVECTAMQSSQQTTFWKVLQEDGQNVDSLEGLLGPRLGLASHPVKKEEMFLPDPVESQRFPGQDSDDVKGDQLKVRNAQLGGNEPVEIPRSGQGKTQENVPVRAEIKDEICETNSGHGIEPVTGCRGSDELTKGLGLACSNPSPVDTEGGKTLFSKNERCSGGNSPFSSRIPPGRGLGLLGASYRLSSFVSKEPGQEWAVSLLDANEERLDIVQGEISKEQAEIFKATQENIDGEVALQGLGIMNPTSLLSPEGQDRSEAELTEARGTHVDQVMNPRKMGLPLYMVESTLMQSNQQTTFWKVLLEDGEKVDSLERPQLGLALHPVKKEEPFLPDPVESWRFPGQDSDDGKGNQLKVKNDQLGGNEPMEAARGGQGKMQENVLETAEMKSELCESNSRQGIEPVTGWKESGELTEGLGAACSNPSPVDTEAGKALFSKYGRRYRPKLDKYHSSRMEVKNYDCLDFEVRIHPNS